jgi:glycosyltransferase involved in cell wall biosynthesis
MVLNLPAVTLCIPTNALTRQIMQSLRVLSFDEELVRSVEVVVVYDGQPVDDWATEVARVQGIDLKQVSMPKAGPAAARNLAARTARADQLIFCDSDVIITTKAVHAASITQPGVMIVPNILPIAEDNQVANFFSEYVFAPRHENGRDYTVSAFWGMSKSDFFAVGGFDERFRYPAGEDMDFMMRWSDSGRSLRYLDEVVVFHRNPTTLKELVNRAIRYGRHGDLGLQPATEASIELAPPTLLDLILFPLALVAGTGRRLMELIEATLTNLSMWARNGARDRGYSWLALPRVFYSIPRFLIRILGFGLALMIGRGKSRVHENRKLTVLWLAAWQYGQITKSSRSRFLRRKESSKR